MTTLWAAVLLIYGVSTGIAMVPSRNSKAAGGSPDVPGGSPNVPRRYAKVSSGPSKIPSRYAKSASGSSNIPSGSSNIPSGSSNVPSGSSNIPSGSWNIPSGSGAVAGAVAGTDTPIQLDMAPNSVDDMYDGCRDQMMKKLPEFLKNEKNGNIRFKTAWESSEAVYNQKFDKSTPFLGKERITAIYYYTFGKDDVYLDFNEAVRTEGPQYKTTFGFHALHFLLTDAIQALKERRSKNVPVGQDGCVTSFRRVGRSFNGKKNTQFRFSSFTSSSWGKYIENDKYGKKTCFEIKTCFGEDISKYSTVAEEREVLIPPYEIFKVIDIKSSGPKESFPCEVEYKVKSAGKVSNFNCALFKN